MKHLKLYESFISLPKGDKGGFDSPKNYEVIDQVEDIFLSLTDKGIKVIIFLESVSNWNSTDYYKILINKGISTSTKYNKSDTIDTVSRNKIIYDEMKSIIERLCELGEIISYEDSSDCPRNALFDNDSARDNFMIIKIGIKR